MKIILKEYIENVGDRDDVVTVADGYARNFLIPKGLAVMATSSEMKQLAHRRKFEDRRQKRLDDELARKIDMIKDSEVEISAHASSEGKLYGSIAQRHIAEALTEKFGIEIDRRRVDLESPIKMIGEYNVTVDMGKERTADVKVVVSSGGGPIEDPDDKPAPEKEKIEAPETAEAAPAAEAAEAAAEPAEETAAAPAETAKDTPEEAAAPAQEVTAPDEEEAPEENLVAGDVSAPDAAPAPEPEEPEAAPDAETTGESAPPAAEEDEETKE